MEKYLLIEKHWRIPLKSNLFTKRVFCLCLGSKISFTSKTRPYSAKIYYLLICSLLARYVLNFKDNNNKHSQQQQPHSGRAPFVVNIFFTIVTFASELVFIYDCHGPKKSDADEYFVECPHWFYRNCF